MAVKKQCRQSQKVIGKPNKSVGNIGFQINSTSTVLDIVYTEIASLMMTFNENNKNKANRLEVLLDLLLPNYGYGKLFVEKTQEKLAGFKKISEEEIINSIKKLIQREYIDKRIQKIKGANFDISMYNIFSNMEKVDGHQRIVEDILNENKINNGYKQEYRDSLKNVLSEVLEMTIKCEIEKEYQKEVKAYTNNYKQFTIDATTGFANNGNNSKKRTFSNVEYALNFQSLVSKLGYSLNTPAEKNVIDELLKKGELSKADESILLERQKVLPKHKER